MVENLEARVEVKKLDSRSRPILPVDWRESEVEARREQVALAIIRQAIKYRRIDNVTKTSP